MTLLPILRRLKTIIVLDTKSPHTFLIDSIKALEQKMHQLSEKNTALKNVLSLLRHKKSVQLKSNEGAEGFAILRSVIDTLKSRAEYFESTLS